MAMISKEKNYRFYKCFVRKKRNFALSDRINMEVHTLENDMAKSGLSASDIVRLLSTETYFELMEIPYPSNQEGVDNFLQAK